MGRRSATRDLLIGSLAGPLCQLFWPVEGHEKRLTTALLTLGFLSEKGQTAGVRTEAPSQVRFPRSGTDRKVDYQTSCQSVLTEKLTEGTGQDRQTAGDGVHRKPLPLWTVRSSRCRGSPVGDNRRWPVAVALPASWEVMPLRVTTRRKEQWCSGNRPMFWLPSRVLGQQKGNRGPSALHALPPPEKVDSGRPVAL